jgi:hypothetical protein
VEITIAAPAADVWRALREPSVTRTWFGWDYDGLDEEITTIFHTGVTVSDRDRVLAWEHGDRLVVEDHDAATLVRLLRSGSAPGAPQADHHDEIAEGWLTFLHQLRFALERHPGEERRTIRVVGVARDGDTGPPVPVEDLGGEEWYRAARQAGLTAPAYGDGLVVLAREGGPRVTATVTTYGLGTAEFAALRRRWGDGWQDRYPGGE